MANPNIKIGSSTYNDISTLRVDRVEGGTADYIYSGIHITSGAKNPIVRNVPQGRSHIETFLPYTTQNIECKALDRRNSNILVTLSYTVTNIIITKE